MENVVSNPNMHNPQFRTGVITPPDDHYRPVLYSHYQATKDFNALDRDLYFAVRKAEKPDRHKTPSSVFVILGLAALAITFSIVKKLIKK